MLADAVAQYLVWKKWTRWLLVYGSYPSDKLLADAYRRSAKRFGAKIVQEKVSEDTGGSRQSDSGVVQEQQQIPVLTQGAPDYDVLVAADENQVFAGYLPYRTWDPRPVAGSAGLEPVTWDASSKSWGGTQLQNRFVKLFNRRMMPLDMQAWTGARMIGEAASHTGQHRCRQADRLHEKPGVRHRCLQRAASDVARLGSATAPADFAVRRADGCFDFSAARLSPPDKRARHARHRSA